MFDTLFNIAERVHAGIQQGEAPVLARVVSVEGMSSRWTGDAVVALPHDQAVLGRLLGGSADDQLLPVIRGAGPAERGRLVEVVVAEADALAAGLACGGRAQVLIQPAADVPLEAWAALARREPVCLVTDLDGDRLGVTTSFTPKTSIEDQRHDPEIVRWFGRGSSATSVTTLADERWAFVESLWPATRLLIVGDGLLAAALATGAQLLEWQPQIVNEVAPAVAAVTALTSGDALVVLTHNRDIDGPVLAAALDAGVGYIGALGSRRTQAARATWLTDRGVATVELGEIRGPAGLDIGARTPGEIALSILAEALSARTGAGGRSLRDRSGPIHIDGLNTPPARYE